MTRRRVPVTWDAAPHTKDKIELLRRYVRVWVEVLGRTCRGKSLTYVDGFAGPGEYQDGSLGSPVAALQMVRDAIETVGTAWVAARVRIIAIEKERARHDHLVAVMGCEVLPEKMDIRTYCSSFEDGIRRATIEYPDAFDTSAPLLVFADPFGATGVPFPTVERILSSSTSELLYSFDADGVARIFAAGENANADACLTTIYGGPHWHDQLRPEQSHERRAIAARECYLQRIRGIARYAYAFGVGRASAHPDYYLVHACRSDKAAQVMTGLMRRMTNEDEFGFYEASRNQRVLFTDRDVPAAAAMAIECFAGKTVPLAEIAQWLVNTAPWVTWKAVLRHLELVQKAIEPFPNRPDRRSGTYPSNKVIHVRFK